MRDYKEHDFYVTCEWCGTNFTTHHRWQKYCTPKCRTDRNTDVFNQKHKQVSKRELMSQTYEIVSDPDEFGLFSGLRLNRKEIVVGLRMGSYTQGTIILHRKKDVKFIVEGNKLRKLS